MKNLIARIVEVKFEFHILTFKLLVIYIGDTFLFSYFYIFPYNFDSRNMNRNIGNTIILHHMQSLK